MTRGDEWDDGPTLDDGLGRGTVRPAPLPKLAPGWERVATPATCTNKTGAAVGGAGLCGEVAPYRNKVTLARSCEECVDEMGVFVPTGGFDGMVTP